MNRTFTDLIRQKLNPRHLKLVDVYLDTIDGTITSLDAREADLRRELKAARQEVARARNERDDAVRKAHAAGTKTIDRLRQELAQVREQLAACKEAANSNTPESARDNRVLRGSDVWSPAYQSVFDAVQREMKHRAEAQHERERLEAAEATINRLTRKVEGLQELRAALDRAKACNTQQHNDLVECRRQLEQSEAQLEQSEARLDRWCEAVADTGFDTVEQVVDAYSSAVAQNELLRGAGDDAWKEVALALARAVDRD